MTQTTKAVILAGLGLVGAILLFWVVVTAYQREELKCAEQFGSEYYFVSGDRSADFCTNGEGDVRYPRSRY